MYHKPKYFKLYELFPKEFYSQWASRGDSLWGLFDDRILWTADQIRIRYGKMSANTWHWGGQHQYRGFRTFDCIIGSQLSQHKFGRATDLVPDKCTAEEIREDIKKTPWKSEFKYITCIEDFQGMSWLHIDCRSWQKNKYGILIVGP